VSLTILRHDNLISTVISRQAASFIYIVYQTGFKQQRKTIIKVRHQYNN